MPTISAIVEGHGEVASVPLLLRRIVTEIDPLAHLHIPRPIRIGRQKIVKLGELEAAVRRAANSSGRNGRILILCDANGDCPAQLGSEMLHRARAARNDRKIGVVLAKPEFEAWFLAAARSLAGHRQIRSSAEPPANPEAIRDAKGWLTARMPDGRSYRSLVDQPALSSVFDLSAAQTAPSFNKLWRTVCELLQD